MGSRWYPRSGDEAKEREDSEIEEHVYLVLYGLQPVLTYIIYSTQYLWNIIVTIWPQFTQQANSGAGVLLMSGPIAPVTATLAGIPLNSAFLAGFLQSHTSFFFFLTLL